MRQNGRQQHASEVNILHSQEWCSVTHSKALLSVTRPRQSKATSGYSKEQQLCQHFTMQAELPISNSVQLPIADEKTAPFEQRA